MELYNRITRTPPPSFRECVTYGKSRNIMNVRFITPDEELRLIKYEARAYAD